MPEIKIEITPSQLRAAFMRWYVDTKTNTIASAEEAIASGVSPSMIVEESADYVFDILRGEV